MAEKLFLCSSLKVGHPYPSTPGTYARLARLGGSTIVWLEHPEHCDDAGRRLEASESSPPKCREADRITVANMLGKGRFLILASKASPRSRRTPRGGGSGRCSFEPDGDATPPGRWPFPSVLPESASELSLQTLRAPFGSLLRCRRSSMAVSRHWWEQKVKSCIKNTGL